MKDLILSTLNELFGNCTTLIKVKRIIALLLIIITFVCISGFDSLGFIKCAVIMCVSAFIWFACGLSDALKDNQ